MRNVYGPFRNSGHFFAFAADLNGKIANAIDEVNKAKERFDNFRKSPELRDNTQTFIALSDRLLNAKFELARVSDIVADFIEALSDEACSELKPYCTFLFDIPRVSFDEEAAV
ncbi:MAG: hypothetical protein II876_04455 [Synergistaceae bacterium]|nr:hypothetical protein [Synergistaceae bacterium]